MEGAWEDAEAEETILRRTAQANGPTKLIKMNRDSQNQKKVKMINEIAPGYTKKQSHSQCKKSSQPHRTVTPAYIESLLIAGQFPNEQKTANNIFTKLL